MYFGLEARMQDSVEVLGVRAEELPCCASRGDSIST
jgi:hypothetical protein